MLILSHPDWDKEYPVTNKNFINWAQTIIEPPIQWNKNVSQKAQLVVLVGRLCYEECFRIRNNK